MTELEYQMIVTATRMDVDDYIEDRLGNLCQDLGWPRNEWLRLSPAGRRRLFRGGLVRLHANVRGMSARMQEIGQAAAEAAEAIRAGLVMWSKP